MDSVKLSDIGNYKLSDLTDYLFNQTDKSRELKNKKIKDISLDELLYLLRKDNFTEIVIKLIVQNIITTGFKGYVFNYDDYSEWQKEAIKELILVDEYNWQIDPISFYKFLPLIDSTTKHHVNLPQYIIDHFLSFVPHQIVWTDKNLEKIEGQLADDSASMVLSARQSVRQLKIAIDNDAKVFYKTDSGELIHLKDSKTLEDRLVAQLRNKEAFLKVIQKEIKIIE